jgi:hypothetical protein
MPSVARQRKRILAREPLLLSTQSVISLSLKTMLNNVENRFFLLNSARPLSNQRLRRRISRLGIDVLVFERSIGD